MERPAAGGLPEVLRIIDDDDDEDDDVAEVIVDWSSDSEVGDEEVGGGELEGGLWPRLELEDPQVANGGVLGANTAERGSDRGGPEENAASVSELGSSRKRPNEEAEGPSGSKKRRLGPAGGVGAEDGFDEPTPSTSSLYRSRDTLSGPFYWTVYEDSEDSDSD